MERISECISQGGTYSRYEHVSKETKTPMKIGLFLPPQAKDTPVPALLWLSGLTCTDENFMVKAGAHRLAAQFGLAIICPDTSPRGLDLPGEHDSYDFGSGAGFYVNATENPWAENYRMYAYIVNELIPLVREFFPISESMAISGHSMGGHGALTIGIRESHLFTSVSAFAPICHPIACPWGLKAFRGYLGENPESWKHHDAVELLKSKTACLPTLIDQGDSDEFLEPQLGLHHLESLLTELSAPVTVRWQPGYDHSYFFVSSFIEDHLRFHFEHLRT